MVSRSAAQLVETTMADLEHRYPAIAGYTDAQRQHTVEDIAHIVDFLASALYTDDDELFTGFMVWTAGILNARGVPTESLHPALELLAAQLRDFPRTQRVINAARIALTDTNKHRV